MRQVASIVAEHRGLIDWQARATYEDARALLGDAPLTPELLCQAVASTHAAIDGGCDAILAGFAEQHGKRVGCREGCARCCYQPVQCSTAELALIAAASDPADWPPVVERAERVLAGDRASPDGAKGRYRRSVACPFLEGGRCGIYPGRPQACRSHFSLSRSDCDREWAARRLSAESQARRRGIPMVGPAKAVGYGAMTGLDVLLHQRGLEVEIVELAEALPIMLQPGALNRWLAGERLFTSIRHNVSGEPYSAVLERDGLALFAEG